MYQCPKCGASSISVLSQLALPLDGKTVCPACKASLRIKRKATNYLVLAYLVLKVGMVFFLPPTIRLDGLSDMLLLIVFAIIQIRSVEYEVNPHPGL